MPFELMLRKPELHFPTHTHMAFVFLFTLFKSLESHQACRGFFYTDTLTKMTQWRPDR